MYTYEVDRLSELIRQIRLEKGWSQQDLADAVGVETASVSRWETGESRPRPRRLLAIAEALGKDISDLMHPISQTSISKDLLEQVKIEVRRQMNSLKEESESDYPLDIETAEKLSKIPPDVLNYLTKPEIDWHSVRGALKLVTPSVAKASQKTKK